MTKFEEEFNYLIELSGKVLIGQVDAEAFEKNRVAFFEKYETDQQQALPVVPDYVAQLVDYTVKVQHTIPSDIIGYFYFRNEQFPIEEMNLPSDILDLEKLSEYFKLGIHRVEFERACIIGYTVEKPQLFYLKHIDMSRTDKECDWYLITDCVKLCHEWVGKNLKPKDDDFKFTQQEIDSMQTGSYERIEVTE